MVGQFKIGDFVQAKEETYYKYNKNVFKAEVYGIPDSCEHEGKVFQKLHLINVCTKYEGIGHVLSEGQKPYLCSGFDYEPWEPKYESW